MDDLIKKQTALDEIDNTYFSDFDDYERAKTVIERIPAEKPQVKCIANVHIDPEEVISRIKEDYYLGGWIPCSERLPEKDGRYLVTCSKIGSWEVDWNIWHNEPKPSWLWEQGVTAWMPLHEPYKVEQDS